MTKNQTNVTCYRFGEFVLDTLDRQLWRADTRIDLNARYLDALVLLVRSAGRLVEKERFFEEVWRGVVVSDSALTQCIKEIRRQLGDNAASPEFIQTVPGHGYRFVSSVEHLETGDWGAPSRHLPGNGDRPDSSAARRVSNQGGTHQAWFGRLLEVGAGTLGGGAAGVLGGMLYGFGLASADAGVGTLSTLMVLVSLNVLAGLIGGFGVSLGIAAGGFGARVMPRMNAAFRIAGAALGGLLVGSVAKLFSVDAFNLLFGHAPAGITGGPEGAALGAALSVGAYMGYRSGVRASSTSSWYMAAGAGVAGAMAGALIPLAGGRLMGGSLDLLAASFAESRLQLDGFGPLFGEVHFGLTTQIVLGGVEGFLFGVCVVGALVLTLRTGPAIFGDPRIP